MLKQRVITALILIPLVLLGLFSTSPFVFHLILAGILLLAAFEWGSLIYTSRPWISGFLISLTFLFYLTTNFYFIFISLGFFSWILVMFFIITQKHHSLFFKRFISQNSILTTLFSALLLTSSWSALNFLRDKNPHWLLLLFLIVWGADIAAYFIGKQFGRHLLASQISPKKTREGAFGALISVFMITLVTTSFFRFPFSLMLYLSLLAVATAIVSIFGDLFESLLKRQAGVKDSGQILPGHGGLLDRIDSLIAAAPIFAIGVYLLK